MKTLKIKFFFTEIWRGKGEIPIFHVIFLNSDISITVTDIILKLCMLVLHILPKGRMSQIYYLSPSFYFMQS